MERCHIRSSWDVYFNSMEIIKTNALFIAIGIAIPESKEMYVIINLNQRLHK